MKFLQRMNEALVHKIVYFLIGSVLFLLVFFLQGSADASVGHNHVPHAHVFKNTGPKDLNTIYLKFGVMACFIIFLILLPKFSKKPRKKKKKKGRIEYFR